MLASYNSGERVTHLYPNDCFYAHLSIYRFASQFCKNCYVLDAGSGTGYGTVYLLDHGARFAYGIDNDVIAVKFSKQYFKKHRLEFKVMDLQKITDFSRHYFDLIFSSNTLEHISDIPAFLHVAWLLLKSRGLLIIAVSPITTAELRDANITNPYHLNIWSPRQWHYVLNMYFREIETYRHALGKPGVALNFSNTPEQTEIDEKDFFFERVSLEQLYHIPTITALFIARKPRLEGELPPLDKPLTFVDNSFTRSSPVV